VRDASPPLGDLPLRGDIIQDSRRWELEGSH
jgi:hypothetical protein